MISHLIAGHQYEEEKDVWFLFCFDWACSHTDDRGLATGPLWWRAQTQRRRKFDLKQK